MPTRRAPARWPMVVVVAVLVGGGITGLVTATGDGDGDRAGAPPSTGTTARVAGRPSGVTRAVVAYRLTYRVEGFAPDGSVIVDTERRWVRLPFDSRVEVFAGEPAAPGDRTFLQIASLGMLQTGRPGEQETVVLTTEPATAPGDARITEIDARMDAGLLAWRHERRAVVGRRCEVFRASGPVDIDRAGMLAADPDGFADLCVDDAGIVLQEDWYVDRRLFRRRTAVELDEGPFAAGRLFAPTGPLVPPRQGGGGLAELVAGSRPAGVPFYELPRPPPGLAPQGRFAYTPPRAEPGSAPVAVPEVASVLDVYAGGGDVVVVDNGGTVTNAAPFRSPAPGTDVEIDGLGTAEVLVGLRTAEVRVLLDGGRFVRVRGSLAPSALLELARALRPAAGEAPGVVPVAPPPSTTVPARDEGVPPAVACTRDDEGRLSCRPRD